MPAEIIPSVLARTAPSFRTRLQVAERLSRRIHVDVMDGRLVKTKSISLDRLRRQTWHRRVEMHLMVKQPAAWIDALLSRMVDEVVIHVEIPDLRYALALLRSNRKKIRLAINPRTPLAKLKPWIKFVHGVQIMTIDPGRNHAPFHPAMLRRVQHLRARYPRLRISCDGGVTPATLPAMIKAGADRCIVGSYVQFSDHPAEAYTRLRRAIQG